MTRFIFLAGAVIVLVPSFLKLSIFQKMMFPLEVQLKNTVKNLSETLIMPRLDVKRKRKRRIICKSRSSGIIFKPKFKNKESAPKLVYTSYIPESSTIVFFSNVYPTSETKAPEVATRLMDVNLPYKEEKYIISPLLYCQGLFVIPHANTILVCNPKTKEVITLPQSSKHIPRSEVKENIGVNTRVGVGFLRSTQAYRVAQFFYRSYDMDKRTYSMGFEVFTLGITRCWRVLTEDPPYPIWTSCYSFTGKRAYFYLWYDLDPYLPNAFLCFDFKNEKFSMLYPPYSLKHIYVDYMRLTNLKNSLCLSALSMNGTRFSVFTSKHGNNIDWTPRFCFNIVLHGSPIVLPIAEYRGNILTNVLDKKSQRLECYNIKDGSCVEVDDELVNLKMGKNEEVLIIAGKPWYHVSFYEESLFELGSVEC